MSNWTAGQATHFGTRGITVNVVAVRPQRRRRATTAFGSTAPSVAAEIARLALFLTHAGGPPHHRADAARQQRRARPLRLSIPAFAAKLNGVTAPLSCGYVKA